MYTQIFIETVSAVAPSENNPNIQMDKHMDMFKHVDKHMAYG